MKPERQGFPLEVKIDRGTRLVRGIHGHFFDVTKAADPVTNEGAVRLLGAEANLGCRIVDLHRIFRATTGKMLKCQGDGDQAKDQQRVHCGTLGLGKGDKANSDGKRDEGGQDKACPGSDPHQPTQDAALCLGFGDGDAPIHLVIDQFAYARRRHDAFLSKCH